MADKKPFILQSNIFCTSLIDYYNKKQCICLKFRDLLDQENVLKCPRYYLQLELIVQILYEINTTVILQFLNIEAILYYLFYYSILNQCSKRENCNFMNGVRFQLPNEITCLREFSNTTARKSYYATIHVYFIKQI